MNVSEAVLSRISTRAFLDRAVDGATLRKILDTARHSPSGGNLQPWHVWAVGGEALARFKELIRRKMEASPFGEGSEYDIYPPKLKEPYRSRRFQCGEDLYATIGVAREDKAGRLQQFARNFDFFGAPAALFFAIDRQMGPPQWSDVGMFLQSIMLLAREQGLHTCPQEAWAVWHKTIREFLDIPEELMLFCGMAIGYMDTAHPINRLRTSRAALDEIATFVGI
jgi:nitroreductase